MFTGEPKPLSPRTESDFLRENKDRVSALPHVVKSELQGAAPQLLSPEHRHYEIVQQRLDALCEWIESYLGLQISQEQKAAILKKVYLVNPEKFSQFAQKNSDQNLEYTNGFIDVVTREMMVLDFEPSELIQLVQTFIHEVIHVLSASRHVAQLTTRGHARHFSEGVTRFGLSRIYGGKEFFHALNEVSTEMMTIESLGEFFPQNEVPEIEQYADPMVFMEQIMLDLANKSKGKHTTTSLRYLLYADMLTGGSEFFKLVRNEYGGRFVRAFARLDFDNPLKLYDKLLELCDVLGSGAREDFVRKTTAFSNNIPIKLMNKLTIAPILEEV